MIQKPNCFDCVFHSMLADSGAHIECNHPMRHREVNHLSAEIAGGTAATNARRPLSIKGSETATRKGWFAWPLNFDPIWLERCLGFKKAGES